MVIKKEEGWTSTKAEFLKDLWENSLHSSKDIVQIMEKKFGGHFTISSIRFQTYRMKIKRNGEYILLMRRRNIRKAIEASPMTNKKKRKKGVTYYRHRVYTPVVEKFIRKNAFSHSARQISNMLQLEFNHSFSVASLRTYMTHSKIKYGKLIGLELQNPFLESIDKFLRKLKTKNPYEIRDLIIEKYEKDIPLRDIKKYMLKIENGS